MPPKLDTLAATVSAENFRFVLSVLESCASVTPDWHQVAERHGIGYPRMLTQAQKFRDLMKKNSYSFEANTLTPLDTNGIASTPMGPKTPKKSSKNAATTPASKKRRVKDAEMEEVSREVVVKDEVGEDGDVADGLGEDREEA